MKNMYKFTAPLVAVVSIPLLVLGGCASNDAVKLSVDTMMAEEEIVISTEYEEQSQEVEMRVSEIEQLEPAESVSLDVTEEIDVVTTTTPKPDKNIISFAFDQSDIDAQYGELLWQHAQYLKENKNLMLKISGHTDSSGARVYNQILSKKRADQVAKILLEFGVPEERIKVEGNASDYPLLGAKYKTEHRRVELDFQEQQIVSN